MSITDKLKAQIARPVVVGLMAALGAKAMGGNQWVATMPILGDVSKPVFYGIVCAGSSFGAEILHNWVLPYLPQSDKAVQIENAVLAPAISAAVNVAVLMVAYPALIKDVGIQEPIVLGIGSEVAGSYAYENFIRTMIM